MLKKMFLFAFIISSAHLSLAQQNCVDLFGPPDTLAVNTFLTLISDKSTPDQIQTAAYEIQERYPLSFEEFLYLHNYANNGNFPGTSEWAVLKKFSEISPLTNSELFAYMRNIDGESAGTIFWFLGPKDGSGPYSTSFRYAGNTAEWVELFIETYKTSSAAQGRLVVNQALGTSILNSDNLARLHLNSEQLSEIISALRPRTLSVDNLTVLTQALGPNVLSGVSPTLLLSRIDFTKYPNHNISAGDWARYDFALRSLLINLDLDFLMTLKDPSQSPKIKDVPYEILIDTILAKQEALSRVGIEVEKEALKYFGKLYSVVTMSDRDYFNLLYNTAQNIAVHPENFDKVDAMIGVTYRVLHELIRYDFAFDDGLARSYYIEEMPLLKDIEPSHIRGFFDTFIKVLKPEIKEYTNLYIYPRVYVTQGIMRAGIDLLKLDATDVFVGEREIKLYIDLRIGERLPVEHPNLWQSITKARLPKMTHEEALAYVRESIKNSTGQ